MKNKNYFKNIRKDASKVSKEFYAETFNLSQVCKWFKETTKYEINPSTGRPIKVEISRPERDYFLNRVEKYIKPEMINPKFIVENSNQTVNGKIMKRKRVEAEESTEENKKYKFILSDVEQDKFSPSFISTCLINYANKQAALIAVNQSPKPKEDNTKVNEVETTTLTDIDKKVEETKEVVNNNKRRNKQTELAKAS